MYKGDISNGRNTQVAVSFNLLCPDYDETFLSSMGFTKPRMPIDMFVVRKLNHINKNNALDYVVCVVGLSKHKKRHIQEQLESVGFDFKDTKMFDTYSELLNFCLIEEADFVTNDDYELSNPTLKRVSFAWRWWNGA